MGMFDSVMVPCADCGSKVEFQTKSGPCILASYDLKDAPPDVLGDINRHAPVRCRCGCLMDVKLTVIATAFKVN